MKKLIAILLCAVLMLGSLSVAATAAELDIADEGAVSEAAAAGAIVDDHAATGANTDDTAATGWTLVSETAFLGKLNTLRSKYPDGSVWEGVYYEDGSAKAWTCFAYAVQMLYEVFGARYYANRIYDYIDYSYDNICAGDIVRIDGDSHSIFIIKVTGDGYYFTDGNGTGIYNQIRWDGFYSNAEMRSRFTYKVHLPGNNLTGAGMAHTIAYDANGGSGNMSAEYVGTGGSFTLKNIGYTRDGFTFAGYTVCRSFDDTWYTDDAGWQTLSAIEENGYTMKLYSQGRTYSLSSAWLGGVDGATTFTFYARWTPSAVLYDANGGVGTMDAETVAQDGSFTLKYNSFTREGYSFEGYTVCRSYDNKWYTNDAGWQTLSAIYDNGYTFKLYPQGKSYTLSSAWVGGIDGTTAFTFYAQWLPETATVEFAGNYSGYNYILGSGLDEGWSDYIYPRSDSIYSLSVDKAERLNNADSLKIVANAPGSVGNDLAIITSTNRGYGDGYSQAGLVGDDKSLTLRFYAKSSVNGAKMYFRWGFSSKDTLQSVTLSTKWQAYKVTLPKNRCFGIALHPFFDKAGTFYVNSLALGDNPGTSNVTAETGGWAVPAQTVTRGEPMTLPVPEREGYTFLGWYTAAEEGILVTDETPIQESTLRLYAHWKKDVSYTPVKTVKYNGHVYELYDNAMGWEDAKRFCESIGGHLVSIGDEMENMTVYDLINGRQGYCWIGLSYQKNTKSWVWTDGTKYSYNKWYSASFGTEDNGAYYAMMYPMNIGTTFYTGKWNKCTGSNYYCSYYGYYNSYFVCEHDEPSYLGDMNGNGEIELTDVTLIQRYHSDMPVDADEESLMRCDVDHNGELEIIDATFIQRFLSGMDTPCAIGERVRTV